MQENIGFILLVVTLIVSVSSAIFNIYNHFRKPDIENAQEIALIKNGCFIRHKNLDKNIEEIKKTVNTIATNHLHDIKDTEKLILNTLEKYLHKRDDTF